MNAAIKNVKTSLNIFILKLYFLKVLIKIDFRCFQEKQRATNKHKKGKMNETKQNHNTPNVLKNIGFGEL
jgi:hypothetical protein